MFTAPRIVLGTLGAALLLSEQAWAQSQSALRFYGAGVAQQDRARIPIDDNAAGPDASSPCDVGGAGFTVEFWVRGTAQQNAAAWSGGGEFFDERWIEGNIIIDRDTWGNSSRDWGVSFAGGRVRFGTGRADVAPLDAPHTLEGSVPVLNGAWRHVAVVRDRVTGVKAIYVDGQLDVSSAPDRSRDDISYPNAGVSGKVTPWCPYIVLAAEKHDAGPGYPSYSGFLDELHIWNRALTQAEIDQWRMVVFRNARPGLVGEFRFEEGSGQVITDSSGSGQPAGVLIAGAPGNGEWVLSAGNPLNVAPVIDEPVCAADFNGDDGVDDLDIAAFFLAFEGGDPASDINGDDGIDDLDISAFFVSFESGC